MKCVKDCFESKELSSSQKQAVKKKGKDRSLLIRKLAASFSLKCRYKNNVQSHSFYVKNCFTLLIHYNQTVFIKDRYNGESVRNEIYY